MVQANPFADLVPGAPPPSPPQPLIPRQPPPQPPPSGYRFTPEGNLEPIPGGSEDPSRPVRPQRLTEQQRLGLTSRYRSLEGLEDAIGELEMLYRENLEGSRGGIFGIGGERNPRARLPLAPTGYETFDNAAGRIIDQIIQTFDITGGEANSLAELRARFGPYMPTSTDNDQTIQSKLDALRGILQRQRADLGSQLEAQGLPVEAPAPEQPVAPDSLDRTERRVTASGSGPRLELSRGDVEADTSRQRVNEEAQRRLTAMLKRGAPDAEIRAYANSLGINVDDALEFRRGPDWQTWRRQNPNQLYPFRDQGANIPMGRLSGGVAATGASPVGTALIHGGNAVAAGTFPLVGDLTGQGEQIRLGLQATRRENPGSALIGDLAGGGLAYGAAGRVVSRVAPNFLASRPVTRSVLGDATYGAIQGTGENYDPLSGALEATGGAFLSRLATRGLASTVSPTGGSLGGLYEQGVRPTVGQRFRESGPIGAAANLIEEGAQSVPIVGSFIRGQRQSARDQWERGAWDMALENIGKDLPGDVPLGPRAMAHARKAFDDAYEAVRSQLSFTPDADWATDLATVMADASLLTPGVRRAFNRIIGDLDQRITQANGTLNGAQFKAAASELNREVRRLRNLRNPTQAQQELLSTLEELDAALHSGARRSSSPEAVAELDRVDRGYAMLARIEDAARRRPRQVGRFTPSDVLQVEARNGGVRGRRFSAGEGLFTDYADQAQALEDILPSSGTPERTALMTSLGAGAAALTGGGAAYALGADPAMIGGAAAVPFLYNAPGARSLMAPRAAPRPFAEWLRRHALETGGAGAAAASFGTERY